MIRRSRSVSTFHQFLTEHAHHQGEGDSVWTQYERNMQFYAWCKARGMYIHAPDPYYMRGINKDGMGYVETNWNLPLWEQINLARQNIYDGTWTKIPSQGATLFPTARQLDIASAASRSYSYERGSSR